MLLTNERTDWKHAIERLLHRQVFVVPFWLPKVKLAFGSTDMNRKVVRSDMKSMQYPIYGLSVSVVWSTTWTMMNIARIKEPRMVLCLCISLLCSLNSSRIQPACELLVRETRPVFIHSVDNTWWGVIQAGMVLLFYGLSDERESKQEEIKNIIGNTNQSLGRRGGGASISQSICQLVSTHTHTDTSVSGTTYIQHIEPTAASMVFSLGTHCATCIVAYLSIWRSPRSDLQSRRIYRLVVWCCNCAAHLSTCCCPVARVRLNWQTASKLVPSCTQ